MLLGGLQGGDVVDIVIEAINFIIESLAEFVTDIAELLPELSPFASWQNTLDGNLLGMINWFVPISEMIVVIEGWGLAIALWYFARCILRWIKAAQ